ETRFYTPVVLRMAEEHAIDLSTVQGTGAHGRVTRKDVERAIASAQSGERVTTAAPHPPPTTLAPTPTRAPETPGTDEDVALTPMRRAIAEHMARARAEIPDAWSLTEIDVTRMVRYRDSLQAD